MKILHVVPSYLPAWRYGGPIRSVHGLAGAQVRSGHQVEVFTTDADGPGRLEVPTGRPIDRDGVSVHYFPRGRPARLFRSPELGRVARRRAAEFDVIHLHSVFLWPTWRAARAAARARVPYVVSPRGILAPELIALRGRLRKRLWIALIERRTLRGAGAIHATSALEAEAIRALGLDLAPRLIVVPNGVSRAGEAGGEEGSGRADMARARGRYWLYLGRLAEKKDLPLLFAATKLVPEIRLLVAGNDDEGISPRLLALARELGIAERVELLGEVRGPAAGRLLADALALVLPSRSENFGNVVLEAFLEGRPAIVTSGVGASEVLGTARAGWIVEPTPEALAAAARELLANPDESTAMGARGRDFVERELGWERIARHMDDLYRQAGAPTTPAARGIPSGSSARNHGAT